MLRNKIKLLIKNDFNPALLKRLATIVGPDNFPYETVMEKNVLTDAYVFPHSSCLLNNHRLCYVTSILFPVVLKEIIEIFLGPGYVLKVDVRDSQVTRFQAYALDEELPVSFITFSPTMDGNILAGVTVHLKFEFGSFTTTLNAQQISNFIFYEGEVNVQETDVKIPPFEFATSVKRFENLSDNASQVILTGPKLKLFNTIADGLKLHDQMLDRGVNHRDLSFHVFDF